MTRNEHGSGHGGCPRVLLTRTAGGNAAWAGELAALGAEPVSLPCLRRRTTRDPELASKLVSVLGTARWLVLTSPRGVAALREMGVRPPARCAVAAVGPATARACREAFGRCELVSPDARAEALAELLAETIHRGFARTGSAESRPPPSSKEREDLVLVLATADRGRRALEERLGALDGVRMYRFEVYVTQPILDRGWPGGLDPGSLDVLFFASPSAVEGFLARAADLPPGALAPELPRVAIGPTTAAALRTAWPTSGLSAALHVAEQPSVEGLWRAFLAARPRAPTTAATLTVGRESPLSAHIPGGLRSAGPDPRKKQVRKD